MDKPMTLAPYEYRDKFSGTGRALPHFAGGSVAARGAAAEFTGWLRRRAIAQHPRLVFPLLDGLRAGRYRLGARRPRNLQGRGTSRGVARPIRRHASDCLCRHLRHVADMAVLSNSYE
jgi:hypothetical protein